MHSDLSKTNSTFLLVTVTPRLKGRSKVIKWISDFLGEKWSKGKALDHKKGMGMWKWNVLQHPPTPARERV
jgi:hypothetical protein